ncbi:PIN-like domain-containing protein [Pseudomonas fluorescens]|uniref:PIN-like domain-containing protein n=1 Tax=Pseudomonas fluorescens TaxID=294 RepID=UPI0005C4A414|nr:PIN-like domain-containing protein [Pseudomonas fluorescens]
MREAFPEHFVGEPERQQKLWVDCIFALDTNVLLDLYRFSDSAREALFKVMESLGERLWIPYQVAAEYFENRLGVIEDQSEAYAKSISGLKVAKEKFNSGSRHPFVSDEVFGKFISSYDLMINELEEKQKTYLAFVSNDTIKARIGTLLSGRVGEPYSEERLLEVAVEGEKRYLESIPPGFQDGGKMPEATTTRLRLKKFGDLILWKQVIDKAKIANRPVILVTGEKKDDWWLKSNKGLVSALPALTKEFMNAVKQDFYIYATDRFLVKANEYLAQNTSEVVVEEVRAINKADAELKEDMDIALLDQALNVNWPSAITDTSNKRPYQGWVKKYKGLYQNPFAGFAEGSSVMRQRSHNLAAQLEGYKKEHDEIATWARAYLASGGATDHEKYTSALDAMSALGDVIVVLEEELSTLRNRIRNVTSHGRTMLDDDGVS